MLHENESNQVEGRNAILELLRSGREIDKIFVQKDLMEGTIKKIIGQASSRGIVIQEVVRRKLDDMAVTKNHQGIIAVAAAHAYVSVEDMLETAKSKGEAPFLILLDGITDPHNLGAVIRSVECAGAHGVIIPKRNAVGLTAVVERASAGALEYVPVAKVSNLTQTVEWLKKQGLWIACCDMDGVNFTEQSLTGPIALVIGSEGNGVGRLLKEKCDFSVSIPMFGQVASLNASVAAALMLYEVVRQRHTKPVS